MERAAANATMPRVRGRARVSQAPGSRQHPTWTAPLNQGLRKRPGTATSPLLGPNLRSGGRRADAQPVPGHWLHGDRQRSQQARRAQSPNLSVRGTVRVVTLASRFTKAEASRCSRERPWAASAPGPWRTEAVAAISWPVRRQCRSERERARPAPGACIHAIARAACLGVRASAEAVLDGRTSV